MPKLVKEHHTTPVAMPTILLMQHSIQGLAGYDFYPTANVVVTNLLWTKPH
jgi:hypothetical protein